MSDEQRRIIGEMKNVIVDAVDPEKVYLFGSFARGEAVSDSDVDLLIVERDRFDSSRSRLQEIRRIRQALRRFRLTKDILVVSRDEVDEWKDSINHIIGRSIREGVMLYERS